MGKTKELKFIIGVSEKQNVPITVLVIKMEEGYDKPAVRTRFQTL